MPSSVRLAHLSDIHFFQMDKEFNQFFSKRWLGVVNFFLRRRSEFDHSQLEDCLSLLQEHKIPLALISGDISCTSSWKEFEMGKRFTDKLQHVGIESFVLPGNHDTYTRKALRQHRFYKSFPSSLSHQKVYTKQLSKQWWLVALDSTLPTPPLCCHGNFSTSLEKELEKTLSTLPKDAHIILANHFPISAEGTEKALKREPALLALCRRHPNIRLYLHGHTHKQTIYDGRKEGLPVLVDAGSVVHKTEGGWHLIECEGDHCTIIPFQWKGKHWEAQLPKTFSWSTQ